MSKAVKLYSRINEYQLAKRADGNWFYREWKSTKYGPNWSKWANIGKLTNIQKVKESTRCQFSDSYETLVTRVYAKFDNKWTLKMNFSDKRTENNVRLPNERN